MQSEGDLATQWPKVERWHALVKHLSSTYGITKIGVPHDFKRRELCGYVLSNCYVPDNTLLSPEKKQLLLTIMDAHIQNADYNDSTPPNCKR